MMAAAAAAPSINSPIGSQRPLTRASRALSRSVAATDWPANKILFHTFKVDHHLGGGVRLDRSGDPGDVLAAGGHAGHPEGGGVSVDDLREALGHHTANTVFLQGLGGVLSASSRSRNWPHPERRMVAPLCLASLSGCGLSEPFKLFLTSVDIRNSPEPVSCDALQVARRNDPVRVDVVSRDVDGPVRRRVRFIFRVPWKRWVPGAL